ncbi:MAG: dTDP-4-dehydrorhamnose reductase [Leptolyngbyaceae bacterium]|nr:dTDP-4-dehydrorhamnose reductase [Leptolyngbyaceae bacterium]
MTGILLVGANGQLGQELRHTLAPDNTLTTVGRTELDLTNTEAIRHLIQTTAPQVVVNAAAYTAVDKAETDAETAKAVNGIAPTVMAEECARLGATLVHVSTDYVFNGQKNTPYLETDTPDPLGVYGRTKLMGEEGIQQVSDRAIIIRTAWVYGTQGKGNFVKTMLRLGAEREELRVVVDQVGSPTWTQDLAGAIATLVQRLNDTDEILGLYHYVNSGVTSWYDFAIAIFEEASAIGLPLAIQQVMPITTAEYPTPAQRPAYSSLSNRRIASTIGGQPPHWRQSLRTMLAELHTIKA